METAASPPPIRIRFANFEVDLESGEIRKNGLRLRLEPKAFQALTLLLRRSGQAIAREDFYSALWPDTHVRFDRSLNTVINQVREVLGDSAGSPRFVETLSRRGYRFLAPAIPAAAPGHPAAIRSLAVLPFEWSAAGSGHALDFFGDGFTESLIDTLARIPGLRVLAANIVSRYRGSAADPAGAARELGVGAVLLGRVARQGRTFRLQAELVDGADGAHLWGDRYQSPLRDLASIRERLSRDIAGKLRLEFTIASSQTPVASPAEQSPAREECLRGLYFQDRMTPAGLERALASFEAAIRRDPSYAPAYAGLADAYELEAVFALARSADALLRVREAAMLALALDDSLAHAHASLALVLYVHDRDWAAAESELQHALELAPSDTAVLRRQAAFLAARGRIEEALLAIRRALSLNPLSPCLGADLAWYFYLAGHPVPAIEHCRRTLELAPDFVPARHVLALATELAGDPHEAASQLRQLARDTDNDPAILASLAHAQAGAGDRSGALQTLRGLSSLKSTAAVPLSLIAIAQTGLGNLQAALDSLEAAANQRDLRLLCLPLEPRFAPLRSHPRLRALHELLFPG